MDKAQENAIRQPYEAPIIEIVAIEETESGPAGLYDGSTFGDS